MGVHETSITSVLTRLNGNRPAAKTGDNQTELTERLLDMIAACTKHFHEKAMEEYNAAVSGLAAVRARGRNASRRARRHFQNCVVHYQSLWKSAVRSKIFPTSAATKSRSGAGSAFRHSVDAARAASRLAQSETAASDISQDPLAPPNARGGRASDESVANLTRPAVQPRCRWQQRHHQHSLCSHRLPSH